MINMVQAVPAVMSSRSGGGLVESLNEVRKAAVTYGKFRTKRGISDDDRFVLTEVVRRGWDAPQFNEDAVKTLQTKVGRGWSTFSEWAMKMFGIVEQVNRATTILAAYHQLRKNTNLDRDAALLEAKAISDDAHGVYGKATRPMWTHGTGLGQIARLPFVFAKFQQNYIMRMAEMGLRGDYKAASYMLLSPAVIAGAGASLLTPLAGALLGMAGAGGDDPEEEFYKWMEESFGMGRFARHGLAGLGGVNLKGSIQMQNPMPTTISEIFGAPGALFTDTAKGFGHLGKGEYLKAGESFLPVAIGTAIKAAREGSEGVSTGSYSPVFYGSEPIKADGLDTTLRAFGFNPSGISAKREQQYKEKLVARDYAKRREEINSLAKKIYIFGKGDVGDLWREVREYNDLVLASGRVDVPMVSARTIKEMLKRNMRPNRLERARGIAE